MSKQFNKYEKKNKTKQKRRRVQEDERRRRKEWVLFHVSGVKSLGTFCAGLHDGLPERARRANK